MIMQIPLNYSYHECITWVEIACISGKDSFFDFSNSLMEKHPNSKWKFCGPIPSGTKVNLINSYLREETTPKNEINRRKFICLTDKLLLPKIQLFSWKFQLS
ncbi:uncharacterized protein LOC117171909 isoform X2 [Belonocnema kinseyi]|uniref:uncharacterized protein LOC117171909 isoform X2 n=1 Tax=Belonocnema kinseyi TaxID=2817044 RepID=UPI00143CDD02|nr:uncharacterized protein LOC117171909 isoform X2 [Belonocnema kinseyi]